MRFGFAIAGTAFLVVATLSATDRLSASSQEPTKPAYQQTGSEGAITGSISFEGKLPQPKLIDQGADPVCQGNGDLYTEDVIIRAGKLANVFVYVRSGDAIEWYSFEPPAAEVSISHQGCRVVPHVMGMRTQQTLKVSNEDATTHNNHFTPKLNPDWNQSLPAGAAPLEKKFSQPEVLIPFKCNQHPWERAYVAVLSHPFFAVSSLNGSYRIKGLPPGQYSVVAWHERFGEQTTEISVGVREQKKVDFTFSAENAPAKP
jgi:carboxypeptidase family protein